MNGDSPVHDHGETVPLKEYIERIIDERDKAVQVAYRNMEQRIERLNELRAEVQEDRGQFLRLDSYAEQHEALEKTVTELERRFVRDLADRTSALHARIDGLESWRLKATGIFLVLVPLAGLIGAAIIKAFG